MGRQLNLGRHWFHKDHYDLPINRRVEIESLCLMVSPRTIVRVIRRHRVNESSVKRLADRYGVEWTENMDHEAVLYEYYKKKGATKLHYCPDWDFMAIHEQSPEYDACTCEI